MVYENRFSNPLTIPEPEISLDLTYMDIQESFVSSMEPLIERAVHSMHELEAGAIANPDEQRMVGHYWLRDPELAPDASIQNSIKETLQKIRAFSHQVHTGALQGQSGAFEHFLLIGIGGSALGPQFVANALGAGREDPLTPHYIDNTDPDGIDSLLQSLGGKLGNTIVLVISKSGGTPETRNGMMEAKYAWEKAGLDFNKHAVAVTSEGSKLDQYASEEGWLERFPMWDWTGGRTSELSAVGLLPAALQGIDIDAVLEGARLMDQHTRLEELDKNPALQLALGWYHATNGKGEKDMVILPYSDRLSLFSRYLQQLIMESLGKEQDLDGNQVHQGISVYGNKGSTDQHAYVQQLREGVPNFFVTFIVPYCMRQKTSVPIENGTYTGDYLMGFYLGTREALKEKERKSITIATKTVDARTVGALIALYERAVGFYASFVNINAYHQPGVEAGKKAAASILDHMQEIRKLLETHSDKAFTLEEIESELGLEKKHSILFYLMHYMNNSVDHPIRNVNDDHTAHVYQFVTST